MHLYPLTGPLSWNKFLVADFLNQQEYFCETLERDIYIAKWFSRKIACVYIPTSTMGESNVRIMIAVVGSDPSLSIANNVLAPPAFSPIITIK